MVQETNRDIQNLTVESAKWNIELTFEPWYSTHKRLKTESYDLILDLNGVGGFANDEWCSCLAIVCIKNNNKKTCLITGIDGGGRLHLSARSNNSQTIKPINNDLIMCLGFTMASFNLDKFNFNWKIRPDTAEVFDFYDLENDFLIRGEVEIHRIDRNGNLKWSFGGLDIWFNPNGEREVTILNDVIELVDFQSNKYVIDYQGKCIKG